MAAPSADFPLEYKEFTNPARRRTKGGVYILDMLLSFFSVFSFKLNLIVYFSFTLKIIIGKRCQNSLSRLIIYDAGESRRRRKD
mmetsp:Transcript_38858/g.90386  ORF Transcript_38858/g.90386 Transcript_38858/m.90386 type:complete len:84 (-) Transcript_38858:3633-3884(-)